MKYRQLATADAGENKSTQSHEYSNCFLFDEALKITLDSKSSTINLNANAVLTLKNFLHFSDKNVFSLVWLSNKNQKRHWEEWDHEKNH